MGYVVKHSTSNVSKTRRKGNVAIGVDSGGYSKTSVSGLYNGVPPVEGKHNFVQVPSTGTPNFYCVDDTELINYANSLGGGVETVLAAKNYLNSRTDIVFTDNIISKNEVTDGLILSLDAKNKSSFLDNEPTTNLVTNPDFNNSTTGWSNNQNTTLSIESIGGTNFLKVKSNQTTSTPGFMSGNITVTGNTTYTLTIRAYKNDSQNIYLYATGNGTGGSDIVWSNNGYNPIQTTLTTISRTFTTPSDMTYLKIGALWSGPLTTSEIYVEYMQLEQKSSATTFVNGTRSQNTTWYDLSGNGNNTTLNTAAFNGDHFISVESPGYASLLQFVTPNSSTINSAFSTTTGGWQIEELIKINDITYPEAPAGTVVSDSAYSSGAVGFDWNHGNSMGLSYIRMGAGNNVGQGSGYDVSSDITIPSHLQTYGRWMLRSLFWDRANNVMGAYVNGVYCGSINISSLSGNSLYDGGGISWGTLYGWRHDGARAGMKAYNKVLSQSEVSQNYYGGDIATNGLVLAVDAGNLTSYESGSTISYSMTGSLSGSLLNGTGYSSEKGGTFVFDGSNDNLQVETGGILGTFQDWSMDAWVKWSNNGYNSWMIVVDQTAYSNYYKNIMVWLDSNSSNKKIAMYHGSWQYGNTTIPPNTWTHIAATTEGQVAKMYVNGQFDVARTFTNWTSTSNITNYLGIGGHANNSSYRFNGNIAVTRIYNKVLSDAEVLQNYNAQKARFI